MVIIQHGEKEEADKRRHEYIYNFTTIFILHNPTTTSITPLSKHSKPYINNTSTLLQHRTLNYMRLPPS